MTDACNLHCPFCYVKQKPANLDAGKAIAYIKDNQPYRVVFHGGEPLLRAADILKIMDAVPEVKEFSVTSNLMLPLTEERLEVLKRCGVATSYSVDRFDSAQELSKFKEALGAAKKYGTVTLLVTLSKPQLDQPPEELCKTLRWLDADYYTLERLRDDTITSETEYTELYARTDEYLYEIFSRNLIPAEQNVLYLQMKRAISNNASVFSTHCSKMVTTLLTDGQSTTSCPNGDITKKKLRRCLACDLFQYCKGDCSSFGKYGCSFPRKTFSYIAKEVN